MNTRSKTTFRNFQFFKKISIWRLLSPLNWKFFNHHLTTLPICQPQIGTFRRRHIGKELMKEFVNEFMDVNGFHLDCIRKDMYPLITPWYFKSIFHRWKMIVKVEGACLQKFCRQFAAAQAYRRKVQISDVTKKWCKFGLQATLWKNYGSLRNCKINPLKSGNDEFACQGYLCFKKKETFKTLFSQTGRYNGPQSAGCPCDLNFWAMAQMFQPPCDDISSCFLVVWRCTKNNYNHSYHALYIIVTDIIQVNRETSSDCR